MEGGGGREEGGGRGGREGGGREGGGGEGGREGESDYCTYKPLHVMCCVCNYYTHQNKPFVAHTYRAPNLDLHSHYWWLHSLRI